MIQFGSGETSSSSTCLPNFAPKNDDTTFAYELVMTDIMMRPGRDVLHVVEAAHLARRAGR